MDNFIICPNCFVASRPGAKFCRSCGTKLKEQKVCTNCNKSLKQSAKFCPACGTRVVTTLQSSTVEASSPQVKRKEQQNKPSSAVKSRHSTRKQEEQVVQRKISRQKDQDDEDKHHEQSKTQGMLFEDMTEEEIMRQYAQGIHGSESILYIARMKNELRELDQMIFRLDRYHSYSINDLETLEKETNDVIKHLQDGKGIHGFDEISQMADEILQAAYQKKMEVLEWMTEGVREDPVVQFRNQWVQYLTEKEKIEREIAGVIQNKEYLQDFMKWLLDIKEMIETLDYEQMDVGELYSSHFSISIQMSEMQRRTTNLVNHFERDWRDRILPVVYFFEDFSLLDQVEREHIQATELYNKITDSINIINELLVFSEEELRRKRQQYQDLEDQNRRLRGRYLKAMRDKVKTLTDAKILSLRSEKEREEVKKRDEEKEILLKATLLREEEDILEKAIPLVELQTLQELHELSPLQELAKPIILHKDSGLVELNGLSQVVIPGTKKLTKEIQAELSRRIQMAYTSASLVKVDEVEIEFMLSSSKLSNFRLCMKEETYVLTTELPEYRGGLNKLLLESGVDFDPLLFNPFEKIASYTNPPEFRQTLLQRREIGERFLRIPGIKEFRGERIGSNFYIQVEFSEIHKEGLRAIMDFIYEISFYLPLTRWI